jgi:hypothetical protein
MDVAVTRKLPRRLPRPLPSLLGDGLPERLRSTSLALIGLVGAAALAMIGLTLQHAVPLISSGPIHEPARSEVSPARVAAERAAREPGLRNAAARSKDEGGASRPSARGAAAAPSPTPAPAGGPVLAAEPSPGGEAGARERPPGRAKPPSEPRAAPEPDPAQPPGSGPAAAPAPRPAPAPVATPSSDPPEPAPEPPSEAPVEEPSPVPGKGHAYGKGGGKGVDGAGPPGLAGE